MAVVIIKDEYLTDIADAIRTKNGLTDTYKPSEMAAAITDLSAGGNMTKVTAYSNEYTGQGTDVLNRVTFDLSDYANSSKQLFFTVYYEGTATSSDSTYDFWYGELLTINLDRNGNIGEIELAGNIRNVSYCSLEKLIEVSFEDNVLVFNVPASLYDEFIVYKTTVKPTRISFLNTAKLYYVQ